MQLFYIENDDFLVSLFEVLFKRSAYSIFTTDETKSIHLIEDQKPELVMISLNFDFDEIKHVIEQIKGIPNINIPVIAIGDEDQVACMKTQLLCDDFITKPIAPLEALAQLEKYFKRP